RYRCGPDWSFGPVDDDLPGASGLDRSAPCDPGRGDVRIADCRRAVSACPGWNESNLPGGIARPPVAGFQVRLSRTVVLRFADGDLFCGVMAARALATII